MPPSSTRRSAIRTTASRESPALLTAIA
jgi:hypothetical protein